jgi:hypothetical protein
MTDAENAESMGFITPGAIREVFGGAINPKHGLYEFPDGSTGRFSMVAKLNPETNRMGYPFESRRPPMEFPDAKADASVDEPVRKTKPVAEATAKKEEVAPSAPGRKVTVLTKE